jgi:8-oxo-dGTP pyrophosphatase MutT (NUDIX family)
MQIQALFNQYVKLYPSDLEDLKLLSEQLSQDDQNILSRKNFVGHVTASAFVVNEYTKKVLLLDHKTLAKLLQPGGHVESEDSSLLGATLREVEEETGLKPAELKLRSVLIGSPNVPFDIDTHRIPANPKKNEPAHYHHDFRYLYTTKSSDISIDSNESNGYKWIEWDRFAETQNFINIAERIDALLEPNPRDYFRSIAGDKGGSISVIAVSHVIPSSEPYLLSLQENFNFIGVIPKPKSIDVQSLGRLKDKDIAILEQFTRQNIESNPEELARFLLNYDNICLVDIGGYFSSSLAKLKKILGKKLLGVVEDTENGLQKYEEEYKSNFIRIVSVARSPLKSFEDQLVGNGVAHAAETILRSVNGLIPYKTCGIIGYGKIGKGIYQYLQQRGIQPYVCELNPLRAIQASCDGGKVVAIDKLIRECEVVFCATGSQAVDILKLRDLKRGAYLASVTSSDDEFDLRFLDSEYTHENVADNIAKYSKRGHYFYLMNNGDAINFLYSAAVDNYIYLVQGELVFSILKIANRVGHYDTKLSISTNSEEEQSEIAKYWLNYILRTE